MKCVRCGNVSFSAVLDKSTRTVGGRVFTADVPAKRCQECGELFFEGRDLSRWSHEIVRDLVRNGPLTGEALAFVRRASGFTAREVAGLLDVTPESISRWEHGKRPIDRPTWVAIGRLATDRIDGRTETIDQLHALAKRPRRRVHLLLRTA